MLKTLIKILKILGREEKKTAILLTILIILTAFLDMLGVASIMPFMSVLSDQSAIHQNKYLTYIYQAMNFESNQDFLFFLGISLFAIIILSMIIKTLTTYIQIRFTTLSEYTLGRKLIIGYLNQPYEWFLNQNSSNLGKTILSEVQQAIDNTITPFMVCIAQGMIILAILSLLIFTNPILAATAGGALATTYGIIYAILRRFLSRIGNERVVANKERFEAVSEAFGGFKEIKIIGHEENFIEKFSNPAKRYSVYQSLSKSCSQLPRFTLEAIAFGGMIILVLTLIKSGSSLRDTLPILTLYAFAGYRLLPAVQNFYQNLSTLRFGSGTLNSLFKNLSKLQSNDIFFPKQPKIKIKEGINIENLSYSYPNSNRPALSNITLKIPAKTTIGLVGSTGSGKSTTLDIILGLLPAHEGCLKVDGIPIDKHNLRAWQQTIGYVPQTIYLSDSTVIENIAFGETSDEIDVEAAQNASKIANLHDFVVEQLPQGYNTKIGERGLRLSGGQRQRIGIARALYHKPKILVLDEATSALDNLTERAVMGAISELGKELTIIMIAHRLSTVENCDQIYLLERGSIIASGTYNELIHLSDKFREMTKTT